MPESSPSILVDIKDQIMELKFNRLDKKNALNFDMYNAMSKALQAATLNPQVRVVLISGSPGCFTSGNDLADFANTNKPLNENSPAVILMNALSHFPKPIVVAIDGVAVGIGTTMLMHCDLAYASEKSAFKMPFVNLGLCPEYGATFLLPRLAGYVKAAELLLLGSEFSAKEALAIGLLNDVVQDPLIRAREQCLNLAKQAPNAIRNTKKLMKSALRNSTQEAVMDELQVFAKSLQGEEFKEAAQAFFEKRVADFSQME